MEAFLPEVRVLVRTGDTTQSERASMMRRPSAHPGYNAGIALHPAHQRGRTKHAEDGQDSDRG